MYVRKMKILITYESHTVITTHTASQIKSNKNSNPNSAKCTNSNIHANITEKEETP